LAIPGGVLLLALYLLAFVFPDYLQYRSLETRSYGRLSYDSRSPDASQRAVKELNGIKEGRLHRMTISFRMKVHSIDKYDGVFQTAPANSGIRMELGQPSIAVLIVPSKTWGVRGAQVAAMIQSLELNTWYSVLIALDDKGHLKAWVDNFLVVDMTDHTLECSVSDIAVGTGFNKSRRLDGEIADYSIRLDVQPSRHRIALLLSALRAMLSVASFMAVMLLCFYFAKTHGQRLIGKLDLSFLSYSRIATLQNILLFHFLVCSLSLVGLIRRAMVLLYPIFPERPLPAYHEWVLPSVYAGKTRELGTYLAGIVILFFYYAALYLLLRHPPRVLSEQFFPLAVRTKPRLSTYLCTIVVVNLLVAYLDSAIEIDFTPALQVALWLSVFLLPFYLHIGTPHGRSAETA
jgi:hypothetical protein